MADTSAPAPTATPAAPAPAAVETPKPTVADEVAADAADLAKQIETATKSARAKKGAAKAKAAKAKAAKPAPAPKAEPGDDGDSDPEAAEPPEPEQADEAADDPKEEKKKPAAGRSPRELLDEGDIDGAFEAAFGQKPKDFKIDSKRWEEWRKAGTRQKREVERLRTVAVADLDKRRTDLDATLEQAERTYGPLVRAKKLYDAGDVVGAIREGFGDDINAFQRKALAGYHGKNPEVEQLRRELRERDEREEARRREDAERSQKTSLAQQEAAYLEKFVAEPLREGSDPQLARLALKAGFQRRVLQLQRDHWDESTRTSITVQEAADLAREEIIAEFGDAFESGRNGGVTPESVRAGSKLAQPGGHAPPTNLSQRGATEASGPTNRDMTDEEQIEHFTKIARSRQKVA